jgi:hypothetical protein
VQTEESKENRLTKSKKKERRTKCQKTKKNKVTDNKNKKKWKKVSKNKEIECRTAK